VEPKVKKMMWYGVVIELRQPPTKVSVKPARASR
jgi:hypothetical protein